MRMDQELSELHSAYSIDTSASAFSETELEDSYCLLTAVLLAGISVHAEYFNEILTLKRWTQLVQTLHIYLLPVHIEHPAVERIVDISRIPDSRERLDRFAPYERYADEAIRNIDPNFTANEDSSLVMERKLTRLVQAVTSNGSSHPLSRFAFDGFGLSPVLGKIPHSCIPNIHLEAKRIKGRIVLEGVALCDIEENEPFTRSFLSSNDTSCSERNEALRRVFGPMFDCLCPKCDFERHAGHQIFYEAITLPMDEIKAEYLKFSALFRLAAAYMQDQQFMAVLNIGKYLIQSSDVNGDVYHLIGAALLSMDRWTEAHRVWTRGLQLFATHPQLENEISKHDVYNKATTLEAQNISNDCVVHRSAGLGRIISSEGPIIELTDCTMVISAAEEYAKTGNGWTTSRHYAVPTTDIPLHLLPDLSEWFNRMISTKIVPIFIRHFGMSSCSMRVHDAFVVKYHCSEISTSQRYLPLHSDESTHSFVLALNPASEYQGGGTYFVDLGCSLRPGELATFSL